MERAEQFEDALSRALQLAYFIHRNKTTAREVVLAAMNKLEVAAQAQDKRLYYQPSGRSAAKATRTKVSLCENQLLQRLIYIESEPYEKVREQNGSVSEGDMITHFIKHLVKITLKRNSFYVNLGISRLLHSYTTGETIAIYDFCVQDPDRTRDDYYYRSRKGRLMREIKDRFGELVSVNKANRGEERFEAQADSSRHSDFVSRCLSIFTPWASVCVIPARFNPSTDVVKQLSFDSKDPDDEHRIEVNRIHSIVHPECFSRLVRSIKLEAPEARLSVPIFALATSNDGEGSDRHDPPTFGDDDLNAIKTRLDERAARRKRVAGGWLRIAIDGVEQARIDLRETTHAQFTVAEDAELIEVLGADRHGDVLLASCLVNHEAKRQTNRSITLESGQELTFNLSPSTDRYGEVEEIDVALTYRETKALRAAALRANQLLYGAARRLRVDNWIPVAKPALAFTLLALLAAGIWFFVLPEKRQAPQRAEDRQVPQAPPEPTPQPKPDQPQQALDQPKPNDNQDSQKRLPQRKESPRQRIAKAPAPDNRDINPDSRHQPAPPEASIGDETRNTTPRLTGVALPEVKSVAIELKGDAALCQQLGERLTAQLSASQRVSFTADSERADAMLKISATSDKADQSRGVYIVRLANATGFVLWPLNHGGSGLKYAGSTEEIAQKIVHDLLAEMQKAAAKK